MTEIQRACQRVEAYAERFWPDTARRSDPAILTPQELMLKWLLDEVVMAVRAHPDDAF